MNMKSIAGELLATGYFSHVKLTAGQTRCGNLVAFAALTDKGHRAIAREGFAALPVAPGLEADTVPIEWHFAAASNPWPAAALESPGTLPAVWSHLEENGQHRLLLEVDPRLSWFEGHFPEQPILAGVVQLHWASLLIQQLFGFDQNPKSIARLKFQAPVVPPAILELTLTPILPQAVHFRYTSGAMVHSQGSLNFLEPEP
jgi:hypothetical protein